MASYKRAVHPTSVVYLTIYRGPSLPPFYIGSTYLERHRQGYLGTVTSQKYGAVWKTERLEHPERFSSFIIAVRETRAQALELEARMQLALDVVKNPLYINEGIAQRRFIRGSEVLPSTRKKLSVAGKRQSAQQRARTGELARLRNRRVWTLSTPTGEVIQTQNLKEFAREHDLNVTVLHTSLKLGRPPKYGKCRGWQLLEVQKRA